MPPVLATLAPTPYDELRRAQERIREQDRRIRELEQQLRAEKSHEKPDKPEKMRRLYQTNSIFQSNAQQGFLAFEYQPSQSENNRDIIDARRIVTLQLRSSILITGGLNLDISMHRVDHTDQLLPREHKRPILSAKCDSGSYSGNHLSIPCFQNKYTTSVDLRINLLSSDADHSNFYLLLRCGGVCFSSAPFCVLARTPDSRKNKRKDHTTDTNTAAHLLALQCSE